MSTPGPDQPVTKLIGGLLLSLGPTSPPRTRRGTQRGSATVPPYAFEEEEHFPHYMTTNSSPGPQAHAFGESWGLPERIHTSTPRPGNLTLGNVDVSPLTDLSLIGHSLLVPQHPQIVVEGERGSPRETRLGQTEGVSAGYEYPRLPDSTRSSGTEGVIAPTPGTGVVHPSPQTVESPMVPAPPEDFSRTMPLSNSSSSKQTNAASSREAPSHSSGIREPTSGHASPPETTSPIKSERTNTVSQPERQWLYGLPESAHYAATQITYTDAKPDLSVRSRAAVADPDERKKTLSEETQASPGMDNDESYEPDSAPSEYSMHSSAVTERRFAHIHDWQETLAEEQSESSFDRVPIATHIDETRRQNTPVFDPWQMKMYNAWGRPYNTIKMGPRRTFTYMVTDRMPHMAGVTPVPPGSPQPSRAPTAHPSQAPSPQPSRAPSVHPSQAPSQKPKKSAGGSHIPSPQPSRAPSAHPSQAQSQHPRPSRAPSPHDEKASQANFHEAAPDAEASGSDPKQKDKGKSGRFEREDFKIPKSERPRPPPPRKDRGFSAPPPGGLFARRLGKGKKPKQEESSEGEQEAEDDNPSDSSSSDSDESSSSSDSSHPKKGETPEQRAARKEKAKHRRRKRKEVKAIRALRLPMPTYNGTADYDTFEAWMGKWESWCKSNGLKKEARIETMRYALLGKASAWFTRHVALEVKGWTLRAVYRQLYENCFPVSFREDLRNKLMTATQHGRPIKDFAKDLENLGLRYDDIDPLTIRRIFWEGVDDYVKLYWIDKGLSLEYTDIDTLVYYAYRVEKREYERRKMERRRTGRRTGAFSTHTSSFGASRVSSGMTTERPRGNANPGQKPQAAVMSAASRPSTSRKGNDRGRASNEPLAVGVRLSSKQTAEHRAQGLCFHCHEQGHESPACPMKQNTESRATRFAAVAPAISSATGEKRALKPRVKRQLKSLPSAAVRVMFAAPPLQNYVSAAVKLSSTTHLDVSETKLALLNAELLGFFDPSTAMRYHLALPSQRFITATSTHLEAPCVDPDEVAVYDVCNRFEIRVPLADIGTTRLDIGGLWARHLGLGNDELGCVFRAEVPDEESWGVKIRGALTLVNGTWCVARSLNDAAEFGHNPTERFLVQGNGETYVVRDQASGIVFEVFPYDLNFGITLRQVLRRPQVFEFAGELVTPRDTSVRLDDGRPWMYPAQADLGHHERQYQWLQYLRSQRSRARTARLSPVLSAVDVHNLSIKRIRAAELWDAYEHDALYRKCVLTDYDSVSSSEDGEHEPLLGVAAGAAGGDDPSDDDMPDLESVSDSSSNVSTAATTVDSEDGDLGNEVNVSGTFTLWGVPSDAWDEAPLELAGYESIEVSRAPSPHPIDDLEAFGLADGTRALSTVDDLDGYESVELSRAPSPSTAAYLDGYDTIEAVLVPAPHAIAMLGSAFHDRVRTQIQRDREMHEAVRARVLRSARREREQELAEWTDVGDEV